MDNIIRTYPLKIKLLDYPKRYSNEIFDKRDKILNENRDRYNKFKQNINPDTNRKIKNNTRLYKKIESEFIINYSYHNIYMKDIEYINCEEYNNETKKLNKDIDDKNMIITKGNDIIKTVIEKIKNLENWESYIEYKGEKYGVSKYFNEIHREKNCMGKIDLKKEYTEIRSNDRPFMSVDKETTYYVYECNKCNHKYEIVGELIENITGPSYCKSYDKPKYW